jgi:AmiR/NasT family two-component response regulator
MSMPMTRTFSTEGRRARGDFAVQNAQLLAHLQRLAVQLQSELETRGVIDRAVGILMSRTGGTQGEAMARLRALSQNEHQQLEVVAEQIVEEAVRRLGGGHRGG